MYSKDIDKKDNGSLPFFGAKEGDDTSKEDEISEGKQKNR